MINVRFCPFGPNVISQSVLLCDIFISIDCIIKSLRCPKKAETSFCRSPGLLFCIMHAGKDCRPFRQSPLIRISTLGKLGVRNENAFFGEQLLPKKAKERI